MKFKLAGTVALVTGGGSGFGRAISLGLAGAGVAVGIADLVPERVEGTLAAIQPLGVPAHGVAGDVGRADQVARLVAEVEGRLGPIDLLVNCAGIYPRSSVIEMAEEEWDRVLTTNLKSVFLLSKAVLPGMIARGRGRIVSMTSGLGGAPVPKGSHYGASKAGLNALTRALAKEVADYGVNVNAIAPGLTDTPMMRGANSPEYIAKLAQQNPRGRLGQPEDVVGTVLFLLSDAAEHITGQIVSMRG